MLLGIDYESEEFETFSKLYSDVLQNNEEDLKKQQKQYLSQIKLDVARTFRVFNLKFLNSEVEMGENKLYNLLKVYALVIEPEIGYTQGMNFIAAIILMNCPNEALACFMFMKVLHKDYWIRMFISSTPKVFDMSQKIMD